MVSVPSADTNVTALAPGCTPANYFVRDVVEIVVSAEDEAPAVPGEADEHPNSPNAGVLTGAQE